MAIEKAIEKEEKKQDQEDEEDQEEPQQNAPSFMNEDLHGRGISLFGNPTQNIQSRRFRFSQHQQQHVYPLEMRSQPELMELPQKQEEQKEDKEEEPTLLNNGFIYQTPAAIADTSPLGKPIRSDVLALQQ